MGRLTEVMRRVFKRSSPEMYEALKNYCQKKGVKVEDALNAAVALYLNSDEEGREELEEAVRQIREARKGSVSVDDLVTTIKTVTELMTTIQGAAKQLVKDSLIAEVKSQMEIARSIAKMGEESGGSSTLEGMLATALLSRIFGIQPVAKKVQTGKGKVEELEE